MSRTLVQPVGQKRLTNVAVVRLKKHGNRFEIACYKNKVLSWRSGVEKDLDEVLQSHTVYTNVGKGVLAKSKDLVAAFGMDDLTKICLEILEKGELQVAGKERESQLSNQFRDIATIVMQKTINPETQRPYTISMIERLMHEIHFAVDPHSNSKKQALDVIRELQKHFPIKRSPMRLRLTLPQQNFDSLAEKLTEWKTVTVSKDESGSQVSIVCEMDPGLFRDCDALVRNLQGRSEILAISVHGEGDIHADHYEEVSSSSESKKPTEDEKIQKQTLSTKSAANETETKKQTKSAANETETKKQTKSAANETETKKQTKSESEGQQVKQTKCTTCDAFVGDAKQYREHFKSDWHKHNLKRKTRQLPPLSAEECRADVEMTDFKSDLNEYSF